MELWDEETETDIHDIGICVLPEMDFPFASMEAVMGAIGRTAHEVVSRGKFLFVLGGWLVAPRGDGSILAAACKNCKRTRMFATRQFATNRAAAMSVVGGPTKKRFCSLVAQRCAFAHHDEPMRARFVAVARVFVTEAQAPRHRFL